MVAGDAVSRGACLVEVASGEKFLVATVSLPDAYAQVKDLTKRDGWSDDDRQIVAVELIRARLLGFGPPPEVTA